MQLPSQILGTLLEHLKCIVLLKVGAHDSDVILALVRRQYRISQFLGQIQLFIGRIIRRSALFLDALSARMQSIRALASVTFSRVSLMLVEQTAGFQHLNVIYPLASV